MLILDEMMKEVVEIRFRAAFSAKEDAKQSNATASEILNELANTMSPMKDKYSLKRYKKIVRTGFREWIARNKGDKSTDEACELADSIMGDTDE